MKKLLLIVVLLVGIASQNHAQSPQKFNYQAVIHNSSNELVSNQKVGMQISILQGSATGEAVYVETQTPVTNANGLIAIEIGTGTTSDDFSAIDWNSGPYFLRIEVDPEGATSYSITGITELVSVPFALHAKTAEQFSGTINESDPVYASSQAAYVTSEDITNLGNLSGINTGDQDLSGYITEEEDPVFTSSQASHISEQDIINLSNLSGSNTGDQDLDHLATKTALKDSTAKVRSEIPDVSGFINTETDPEYNSSVASEITEADITNWNNKDVYSAGTGIAINDFVISATTNSAKVPVLTTSEIVALSPEEGDAVYNATEALYQVYTGATWQSIPTSCWPQPTLADAGENQSINDGTLSTTLSGNMPEAEHGEGLWTLVSGTGGTIADPTNPTSGFTGQACTSYQLEWSITTDCGTSTDNVTISFNQTPTTANAGSDIELHDGSTAVQLAANAPEANHGTGTWTIVSGEGGSFSDIHDPTATFNCQLRTDYVLKWTISTDCGSSSDNMNLIVWHNVAGPTITDIEGNSYNTVYIGKQLWMAENLATTTYKDGTTIDLITDRTEWHSATTPAYCWYDNDSITNKDKYGALYNWYTVGTGMLCPTGWHVPTDQEWMKLLNYLYSQGVQQFNEAVVLKATSGWYNNANGTDDYDFSLLPGGTRDGLDAGDFDDVTVAGKWWQSTSNSSTGSFSGIRYYESGLSLNFDDKAYGNSVRCIKD